jgi:hypothetical protein
MAFQNGSQRGSRLSLDDVARSSDRVLNWAVVAMLAAFVLGAWSLPTKITLMFDQTGRQASTVTQPVTSPAPPRTATANPSLSPNPGRSG